MISLKVVKKDSEGIKNQFIVTADEPVTIEVMETHKGHTLAHVYRGNSVGEFDEPVGAYDSDVNPTDWTVE